MTTFHERAAGCLLQDYLRAPESAAQLSRTRQALAARRQFQPAYVAAVGQSPWGQPPGEWPFEQVAAFLHVHTMIMLGEVLDFTVEVGTVPKADARRAENARALLALRDGFSAEVDSEQRCAEGDGLFSLTQEKGAFRSTGIGLLHGPGMCGLPSTSPTYISTTVHPFVVPLEIGTTLPSRTLAHIGQGGVARWPYEETKIRVFLDLGCNRPPLPPTSPG